VTTHRDSRIHVTVSMELRQEEAGRRRSLRWTYLGCTRPLVRVKCGGEWETSDDNGPSNTVLKHIFCELSFQSLICEASMSE